MQTKIISLVGANAHRIDRTVAARRLVRPHIAVGQFRLVRHIAIGAKPRLVVPKVVLGLASRPRRILPLRLARQPVGLARAFTQPPNIGLGVAPADAHHRLVVLYLVLQAPPTAAGGPIPFAPRQKLPGPASFVRIPLRLRAVARRQRELLKLPHRHLVSAQGEVPGNPHLPHRPFIRFPNARQVPHSEAAGGNHHHLRAVCTVPEWPPRTVQHNSLIRRLRPAVAHRPPGGLVAQRTHLHPVVPRRQNHAGAICLCMVQQMHRRPGRQRRHGERLAPQRIQARSGRMRQRAVRKGVHELLKLPGIVRCLDLAPQFLRRVQAGSAGHR